MAFDPNGYVPRGLLTLVALITAIGPYLADWNETHIYNPLWPGHALFHNGQTMSMGVYLGLCTLWKTHWDNTDNLLTASVFAAMYYVTMFSAYFYPNATAWDPPQTAPVDFPQMFVLVPSLIMIVTAYGLEQARVKGVKGAKKVN